MPLQLFLERIGMTNHRMEPEGFRGGLLSLLALRESYFRHTQEDIAF